MNLEEAQRAADQAAQRCAHLLHSLRAPAVITLVDTHRLLTATQQLAAATLELDARVRGVAEPKQTRD